MAEETPEEWLKATKIPVHEEGKVKHCENYREINLSTVSKFTLTIGNICKFIKN